jgi:hypothetical protein
MYEFKNNTPAEDKEFFGNNPGEPFVLPKSQGMMKNVLTTPCKEINKTVPYFQE